MSPAADRERLEAAGIDPSREGLRAYLAGRIPSEETSRRIDALVGLLDDPEWAAREEAQRGLEGFDSLALPALERATESGSPEVRSRAVRAIEAIRSGNEKALLVSAARYLSEGGMPEDADLLWRLLLAGGIAPTEPAASDLARAVARCLPAGEAGAGTEIADAAARIAAGKNGDMTESGLVDSDRVPGFSPETRLLAVFVLVALQDVRAVDPLIALVESENRQIARTAAGLLFACANPGTRTESANRDSEHVPYTEDPDRWRAWWAAHREGFEPARLRLHLQEIRNAIGMRFRSIPAGEFLMGTPEGEEGRQLDETQHRVRMARPFYMQTTEVTQAQWEAVMGSNPSDFKGETLPVETVSWEDCQEFIRMLNAREGGEVYRLPTEAEWEYACRAGTTTRFHFGDSIEDLGEYAWYRGNSDGRTHPVGEKRPNAWGLHDMHGNVFEWCADWYGEYPAGEATDPTGPATGEYRVLRGGAWFFNVVLLRAGFRWFVPSDRNFGIGFRLARSF